MSETNSAIQGEHRISAKRHGLAIVPGAPLVKKRLAGHQFSLSMLLASSLQKPIHGAGYRKP
jgi:hypothetical protein